MKRCSVKDCNKIRLCKKLCSKHYYRMKRHGSLVLPHEMRKCSVPDCLRPYCAGGFCRTHYMKMRRDGTLEYTRKHDDKVKERALANCRVWKKRNWESYKFYLLNRKSRVRKATPKWQKKEELLKMYKLCPKGFHVDHIIPLNGANVCGLHTVQNLQYLPAKLNLSKGNR